MDVDDFVKLLIPKSTRKKLKKQLKKKSLWGLLLGIVQAILGSDISERGRPRPAVAGSSTAKPVAAPMVQDDPLAAHVMQARQYQANIEALVQASEPGSMQRMRLEQLYERVATWVHMIEDIATKTAVRRDDPLLAAEKKRVPAAIKRLEKDLANTTDSALRQKLEKTLTNRQRQLAQLEQMGNARRIAELKVENTLAQLGIIYSQLHSGQYLAERGSYDRLTADISHEVDALEDYLVTLGELQHR